jgi:hypothetical protein
MPEERMETAYNVAGIDVHKMMMMICCGGGGSGSSAC